MSRYFTDLSKDIQVTRGLDHAVGRFVQVRDDRLPASEDPTGEGYVLDWDEVFDFSINVIEAKLGDLYDDQRIIQLCDELFLGD